MWPSGAACITRLFAIVPPAPTTFSTTTDWPSDFCMRSAIRRAMVSVGPPAENGTMTVIGRLGNPCANAPQARVNAAKAAKRWSMCMSFLPHRRYSNRPDAVPDVTPARARHRERRPASAEDDLMHARERALPGVEPGRGHDLDRRIPETAVAGARPIVERRASAQEHEQRALADRAGEVRGHVAGGHDDVASLDRRDEPVEVVEEVEALQARQAPAGARELLALRARIAVLQVEQTRVERERVKRRERGRPAPAELAAYLGMERAPRDADQRLGPARGGSPVELFAERARAPGVGRQQRARLRGEARERGTEEAWQRAQGDVRVAAGERGGRFIGSDHRPIGMRAPEGWHQAAIDLRHEACGALRELGQQRGVQDLVSHALLAPYGDALAGARLALEARHREGPARRHRRDGIEALLAQLPAPGEVEARKECEAEVVARARVARLGRHCASVELDRLVGAPLFLQQEAHVGGGIGVAGPQLEG